MMKIFAKITYWLLIFFFGLMLSACTVLHVKTQKPQERQEVQESPKVYQSHEPIRTLKPTRPLKYRLSPLVLLLDTNGTEEYDPAKAAIKSGLKDFFPEAEYMYYLADGTEKLSGSQFISPKTKAAPAMIISLGIPGTEIAETIFADNIPRLAVMISDANSTLRPQGKNTAIILQIPTEVHFQWIKQIMPGARRIGILYDPAINRNWVEEAQNLALLENFEIVPYAIDSPKQLRAGLRYISRYADVLLAIPDQTVFSTITAKEILLFCYRNHLPFVGLSDSWVKAGALYAIEIDYESLGRQIGELAKTILTEGSPGKSNLYHTQGVTYSLNLRTKDYLGLEMNEDLINGASILFE